MEKHNVKAHCPFCDSKIPLGGLLKRRREAYKMSRQYVARTAHMSATTIRRIENDDAGVSIKTLTRYASCLAIDLLPAVQKS